MVAHAGGWLPTLLIMSISVATFLAFWLTQRDVALAQDEFYQKLHFLDFWIPVRDMPLDRARALASMPGVQALEARQIAGFRLRRPKDETFAKGLVLSMPADRRPTVNDVTISVGRSLQGPGELLLEARCARALGYQPGDLIEVARGRRLQLVGLFTSPEWMWYSLNAADPRPAYERLAIFFATREDVESLQQRPGTVQELHVRLKPGVRADLVSNQVALACRPHIDQMPVLRSRQASHALLERDRRLLRGIATGFPLLLGSVAFLVCYSHLWQLLSRQIQECATLLCLGLSHRQLTGQYLAQGCAVGLLAGISGGFMGEMLSGLLTKSYAHLLGLPFVSHRLHPTILLVAAAASVLLGALASLSAALRIRAVTPAQAQRPAPELAFSALPPWVGRLTKNRLWTRMALRSVVRHPWRSAITGLALSASIAGVTMVLAILQSQKEIVDFYFERVHLYDLQVDLVRPIEQEEVVERFAGQGVSRIEPGLRVGAALAGQGGTVRLGVWGLGPGTRLLQLFDPRRRPIEQPQGAEMALGPIWGRQLGNDKTLSMHLGEAPDSRAEYEVVLLYEPIANPAKVSLTKLQGQFAAEHGFPKKAVNLLLIKVEPGQMSQVKRVLAHDPLIRDVVDARAIRREVEAVVAGFSLVCTIMLLLTAFLGTIVLTGTTVVQMVDRRQELTLLAALGTPTNSLFRLCLTEFLLLWIPALALGVTGGWLAAGHLLSTYQNDLLVVELVLAPKTIMFSAAFSLLNVLAGVGLAFSLQASRIFSKVATARVG